MRFILFLCLILSINLVHAMDDDIGGGGGYAEGGGGDGGSQGGATCQENHRVDADGNCVACLGGRTRPAGDDPDGGIETKCNCAANERVNNNQCVACPALHINKAGNNPNGADTECLPLSLATATVIKAEYNERGQCT